MVLSVMRLKTAVNAVHAAHAGTLVYLISVIQNTREGLIMSELQEWKSRVNEKARDLYAVLNEQCAARDLIDSLDDIVNDIVDENFLQYGTDLDNGMGV